MKYTLSNTETLQIDTVVLDLNGTLAVRGQVVEGVYARLDKLKAMGMRIVLLSGDQRGNAPKIAQDLGIEFKKAGSAQEKEQAVLNLDSRHLVAIGNARIDIGMFKHATLSIATLQGEGIHLGILNHVDILVTSISDALDLLIDGDSLTATLKN